MSVIGIVVLICARIHRRVGLYVLFGVTAIAFGTVIYNFLYARTLEEVIVSVVNTLLLFTATVLIHHYEFPPSVPVKTEVAAS
jgi:hypothetical protein